jgi:hypothetical protein
MGCLLAVIGGALLRAAAPGGREDGYAAERSRRPGGVAFVAAGAVTIAAGFAAREHALQVMLAAVLIACAAASIVPRFMGSRLARR